MRSAATTTLLATLVAATCACEPPPPPADPCLAGDVENCPCAPGFRGHASGTGCVPIVHDGDCPAGTRAALGSLGCVAVGVAGCSTGFEREPSGWGCRAVLPDTACGEESERLGRRACVPIGDCAAGFPPADATLFVDDDFTAAQLDATHFATIGAALSAAAAGAVIAVEAGTYREWLNLRRAVRVVGRCAAQVLVQSAGAGPPGAQVSGVDGVELQGLTLAGHEGGIVVVGGALTAREMLLRDNRAGGVVAIDGARVLLERVRVLSSRPRADGELGHGLFVTDGASLDASDCSFVDNSGNGVAVQDPGSVLTLARSVVLDTAPDGAGRFGKGAAAGFGARIELVDSALLRSRAAGLSLVDGSLGRVQGSVIAEVRRDPSGGFAIGIELDAGSTLELLDSSVHACQDWALFGTDAGTHLDVQHGTIVGAAQAGGIGGGLHVRAGAGFELADSAVVGAGTVGVRVENTGSAGALRRSLIQGTRPAGPSDAGEGEALIVAFGSRAEVEDCTLRDSQGVGVLVGGDPAAPGERSELHMRTTLLDDTLATADDTFGFGLQVSGAAAVELQRCALARHRTAAIVVGGEAAALTLGHVNVTGTRDSVDGPGHGVVVADLGQLQALDLHLLDNGGVGLACGRAAAVVDTAVVARNQVGIHVQGGTLLREVEAVPASPVAGEVLVSRSTQFIDNGARVGSGEIALPAGLELAP